MTTDNSDEATERLRQERERAKLKPVDRIHGVPPRITSTGLEDLRSKRRKGRVVQMSLRMQLRVRAALAFIMDRDNHEGLPELFEIMMQLYLEKYGGINEGDLPSEDDMIRQYLKKQDEKDGE